LGAGLGKLVQERGLVRGEHDCIDSHDLATLVDNMPIMHIMPIMPIMHVLPILPIGCVVPIG